LFASSWLISAVSAADTRFEQVLKECHKLKEAELKKAEKMINKPNPQKKQMERMISKLQTHMQSLD